MFNNLIESKAKKQRNVGSWLTSALINGSLMAFGIYATANAATQAEKPQEEKIDFVEMKKEEPPPPKDEPPPPPPPDVVAAPPVAKGFQVLQAPVDIPDVIPDIDLSKKVTDEADFSGKGVAGGTSKGDPNVKTAPIQTDQPYFDFQVEKPAAVQNIPTPRFPEMLRSANVSGEVIVQFIVDTTGRAEMSSFKVLKEDHPLFAQSAKQSVQGARFLPAEVGGRKVRQLVQLPLQFTLAK